MQVGTLTELNGLRQWPLPASKNGLLHMNLALFLSGVLDNMFTTFHNFAEFFTAAIKKENICVQYFLVCLNLLEFLKTDSP